MISFIVHSYTLNEIPPLNEIPLPCDVLGCNIWAFRANVCRELYCPHRWQREGEEDRREQEGIR